ncbi:hypothetical protein HPB47_006170 [Ixodes persulcatus]|uniref:Uncharacterized protein n=1 Tax=Ixodes persulcatus TaxID=34615 RepID=A0AC60PB78_IXOPE|nr:hypothetical protein HPB47_006170 [Ixodes persulcatus]
MDWYRLSVPQLFLLSEALASASSHVLLACVGESVEEVEVVSVVEAVPAVPLVVVPQVRQLRWLQHSASSTMRALGVEFAPLNIPLKRRMQTLAVLFCAFLFFLNVVWGAALFAYLLFFTPFYFVPLLYTIWLVYDFKTPKRGGRPNGWVRRWLVWKYARDYYPVSLVKTGELDPNRNYIFGYHPHGISCVGAFLNFGTDATGVSELFPGITTVLLTLNVNVHCPFSRELCLLCGLVSADRDSLQWTLTKQGVGNAAVIAVGGAQGGSRTLTRACPCLRSGTARDSSAAHCNAVCTTAHHAALRVDQREASKVTRGAHAPTSDEKADLVPVFAFGENDIYYQAKNPPGSRLRWFQEKMKALTGFSPVIFHGRGIFQYNFGYVPFRERIVTVGIIFVKAQGTAIIMQQ